MFVVEVLYFRRIKKRVARFDCTGGGEERDHRPTSPRSYSLFDDCARAERCYLREARRRRKFFETIATFFLSFGRARREKRLLDWENAATRVIARLLRPDPSSKSPRTLSSVARVLSFRLSSLCVRRREASKGKMKETQERKEEGDIRNEKGVMFADERALCSPPNAVASSRPLFVPFNPLCLGSPFPLSSSARIDLC